MCILGLNYNLILSWEHQASLPWLSFSNLLLREGTRAGRRAGERVHGRTGREELTTILQRVSKSLWHPNAAPRSKVFANLAASCGGAGLLSLSFRLSGRHTCRDGNLLYICGNGIGALLGLSSIRRDGGLFSSLVTHPILDKVQSFELTRNFRQSRKL